MEWLARPLLADSVVVAEPLDPIRITDDDLKAICLRMSAILDTIERPRCEGRLLPVKLFDAIDTLTSDLQSSGDHPPRLTNWAETIREFGEYYALTESGPILVDPVYWREANMRFFK